MIISHYDISPLHCFRVLWPAPSLEKYDINDQTANKHKRLSESTGQSYDKNDLNDQSPPEDQPAGKQSGFVLKAKGRSYDKNDKNDK